MLNNLKQSGHENNAPSGYQGRKLSDEVDLYSSQKSSEVAIDPSHANKQHARG